MEMKEKFRRFMTGRYGVDQLSRVYLVAALVLMIVASFARRAMPILDLFALFLLGYTYYRMFSRDISKMYAQNQKYLNFRYKQTVKWNNAKKRFAQRKEYRFFRCPQCRQRVRVPRGRGKICITCPKCKAEFIKRS